MEEEDEKQSPISNNTKTRLMIQQEFSHHHPSFARLNNGSFGCCPSSVLAAQRSFQLRFLRHPDAFHLHSLPSDLLRSRTLLQHLINAQHLDEISLIDNATTAAALVLHHISLTSPSPFVVVVLHCAFQAVKKSLHAYVMRSGGSVVEIRLPFPVRSHREIIAEFRKGLESAKSLNGYGGNIRLAIIDHITSMPSVLIPVRELVEICREEGVEQVFVDAAHALGTVPIDVKEIGADFYVSNLHKWFFCPPSVAVLYCRKSKSNDVPLPIDSSLWTGTTRDYSAQLLVPAVMEFVNRFEGGIDGIMKRNHDNVVEMGKMLAESWGTILGSPPHMCASMIMVGLPSRLCITSDDDASRLRTHLRECFGVEVAVYYQPQLASASERHGDCDDENRGRDKDNGLITAYARISHQIYNTVDDYLKFRDAINQLLQEGKVCKMLSTE